MLQEPPTDILELRSDRQGVKEKGKSEMIPHLNVFSAPEAYSNCCLPTDIQETSIANP